jgi:hypothetical protein
MTAKKKGLRPFFGLYGGKWRDAAKYYPPPRHDTIIEPFAGSAGYSLRYSDRRVILCERDEVIAGLWSYLIKVSPAEILRIPDVPAGGTVDELKICQEARWLVGFWLNRGTASPRKTPSAWMRQGIRPGCFWGDRVRQTVASQVDAIRHWEVHQGSYEDCPYEGVATWFVDPPYKVTGRYYRYGSALLDYEVLGSWCKSRNGQILVCENEGANWLPFCPLKDVKTSRPGRRSIEVLWACNRAGDPCPPGLEDSN